MLSVVGLAYLLASACGVSVYILVRDGDVKTEQVWGVCGVVALNCVGSVCVVRRGQKRVCKRLHPQSNGNGLQTELY